MKGKTPFTVTLFDPDAYRYTRVHNELIKKAWARAVSLSFKPKDNMTHIHTFVYIFLFHFILDLKLFVFEYAFINIATFLLRRPQMPALQNKCAVVVQKVGSQPSASHLWSACVFGWSAGSRETQQRKQHAICHPLTHHSTEIRTLVEYLHLHSTEIKLALFPRQTSERSLEKDLNYLQDDESIYA